jgi:hypothetical protein
VLLLTGIGHGRFARHSIHHALTVRHWRRYALMDLMELVVNGSLSFLVRFVHPNDQVVRRLSSVEVRVMAVTK